MDVYTKRTNGTYIERKFNDRAILWRFTDADPEFGTLQATELHDHLETVLASFPLSIIAGKGYIEVRALRPPLPAPYSSGLFPRLCDGWLWDTSGDARGHRQGKGGYAYPGHAHRTG